MTLEELQNKYVRLLANKTWVRYWCHINYPHSPVIMGIQARDDNGHPQELPDLKQYKPKQKYKKLMYEIPRTNEDGTPFESNL